MKALLSLVIKDVRLFSKDKIAVALTFIVPLVMIVIFGLIFGGLGGDSSPIRIIAIDHSHHPIAQKIMRSLDSAKSLTILHTYKREEPPDDKTPFDDSTAAQWVRNGKVPAALIIPADALTDTAQGLKLSLLYDPRNEIESQMLEGILQQTIMTKTPGLFPSLMQRSAIRYLGLDSGQAFNNAISNVVRKYFNVPFGNIRDWTSRFDSSLAESSDSASDTSAFFSNLIKFDRQQLVGKEVTNPMVTRSMGGWAIMFVLFTLTAAARSIITEREWGTLHRLLSSPITRGTMLLSKFCYTWLLGIVQIIVLFFCSSLIFSVDIYSNAANLFVMIVLSAGAATSFGMLLAAVAKTSAQADGLSTILILSMSALGGSWFPVTLMPSFIQTISKFTLTYWSVEGFLDVLWRQFSIVSLLPHIAVLAGITVAMTGTSLWIFKKRETW